MADVSPTTQTVSQAGIPTYARPYVESMLGATQQQLFNIGPEGQVLGLKGYTPYSTDPTAYVAGFSPLQQQAFQGITNLQVPGQYGTATSAIQDAIQRARQASQYSPTQFTSTDVSAPGLQQYQLTGPQQVGTGAFTDPNVARSYMSPYMQNVVDVQKQQALRDYQEQMPALQAQAVKAGAYGGSRDAVQRAIAQRSLNQQLQNIQATGQQQAYQQGMQQYSTDAARQMQAALANQAAGLTAGQANLQALLGTQALGAGQSMQAQLANQQARMAAQQAAEQSRQYGAGLGMQGIQAALSGAGQLAGIGGQQLAAQQGILGAQLGAGAQQQAQQQAIINQAIQNYQTAQQYPQQQLAFMNSMIRGLPMQDVTTQTYQASPSVLSQLAAFGTGMYGLNKLFGGDGASGGGGGGFNLSNIGKGISDIWSAGKNIAGDVGKWFGFEEGGEVKRYNSGGITSIDNKVRYNPLRYSDKQVQQSQQNNSISGITALLALNDIAKAKQAYAENQALQQAQQQGAQQTILEKLATAAGVGPEPVGIDQADINPEMFRGAGGGIVAFKVGGDEGEDESDDSLSSMVRRQQAADIFYEGDTGEEIPGIDMKTLEGLQKYYLRQRASIPEGELTRKYKEYYSPAAMAARAEQQKEQTKGLLALKAASILGSTPSTLPGIRGFLQAAAQTGTKIVPEMEAAYKAQKAAEEAGMQIGAGIEGKERAEKIAAIDKAEAAAAKIAERKAAAALKTNEMKDYVKYMTDASVLKGDKRPRQLIEADHAEQFQKYRFDPRMIQAGAAAQQAGVAGTRAITDIEEAISKSDKDINKEYNTQILMAETPAEKARLEQERDAKKERRAAEIRRGNAPAQAPAAAAKPAEAPLPLPARKEDLVSGKTYNTARGPAKWNGSQFIPVQ